MNRAHLNLASFAEKGRLEDEKESVAGITSAGGDFREAGGDPPRRTFPSGDVQGGFAACDAAYVT